MNMKTIIKNSLKYPFSDWKKILIFGIFISFAGMYSPVKWMGLRNETVLFTILFVIFIFNILIRGYGFRIFKTSLIGVDVLPDFNSWWVMFKDGIRVFIVILVYLIPAIAILLYHGISSLILFGVLNLSPMGLFLLFLNGLIYAFISGKITIFISYENVWFLILGLYSFIIIPVSAMAIVNMANHNCKLRAAFKIDQIFSKIAKIGLTKIIIFYIITIIPYSIAFLLNESSILVYIIMGLIIYPYLNMYLDRLTVLLYKEE